MSFRLFVANVACLLQASSGKSGLKMMPVSKLFTEAFHVKPATASEKLYAKDDVKDPIFHDSADCHIDAHCHRHLQPTLRHYRIKDETDLIKFCKDSENYCRLFFIDSKRSRTRLLVTRKLFDGLIERCKVFKTFRDFVVSFGPVEGDEPHEHRSPQHVHRKVSQANTTGTKHEECGFECAYELRYAAEKEGPTDSEKTTWSVRQMAVYHGVRMNKDQATSGRPPNVQGTLRSNLIAICAPEEIKTVFHSYSKEIDSRNGSWAQCFEIHLLILHELLGTWRPYLRWLTLEIASSTKDAILAGSRVTGRDIDAREQSQKLKRSQDSIEHSGLSIECLLDTTESLARSYERHARNSLKDWDPLDDEIEQAFKEKIRLLTLIKHDFSTLREKGHSTAVLFSRLSEVQAAEDTATAIEDSKIVKVLSFFTVFYLPTAILGNFFSSSFVDVDEERHRMVTVKNWWVYWVVIGSFTIATVFIVGIQGDVLDWWDFGWLHHRRDDDGKKKKYRFLTWFSKTKPAEPIPLSSV